MKNNLVRILRKIEADHADHIGAGARNYKEVDLSKTAAALGLGDARDCYRHVNVIVPLKASLEGMKVRIDGRTFVNYVQFDSGLAVPNYVAEKAHIPHKRYEAWNRMLRFISVGRNLCFATALGLVLCYWIIVSDVFGWQKGSNLLSSALYGLLVCWGVGIIVLALLDTRSRFQDYKRAKDLFFENGFKTRIAKMYSRSKCQRDAARVAAKDLGLSEQLDSFYRGRGYDWYHIFPDFIFKMPWIVFSRRYWQKTLFESQYTSIHFLW